MDHANRPKVLMLGVSREGKGGVAAVVNSLFGNGLGELADVRYLETVRGTNKLEKLYVALRSYLHFCRILPGYDIVHVQMATDPSFTRKSLFIEKAHRAGKKIIIHQHGGDFKNFYHNLSSPRKQERIRHIFALADRLIVLSEEWERFFGDTVCDRSKIVVLKNGVMLPAEGKRDYSDKNILFLGRIEEEKGMFELLAAFARLVREDPALHLYCGGDGKHFEECRAFVAAQGLEDNVSFLGWVSGEKEELFRRCSVFILPSHFEALPMSVLEAMSHGLAVIATDVGGIPSVVLDGETGLLIERRSEEQIADSIRRLMTDPALKERLGVSGREKIRREYDIAAIVPRLAQLYSELQEAE